VPGEVKHWKIESGREIGAFVGHTSEVKNACFSGDGSRLATGSADKTVRLWDVATRMQRASLQNETGVFEVEFIPESDLILTSDFEGTISLWNTTTAQRVSRTQCHAQYIPSLDLSSDLSILATAGNDGSVKLWPLEDEGNTLHIAGPAMKE
jgi:WD40 repeat protein